MSYLCEKKIWAPLWENRTCSRKATRGKIRDHKLLCTYHDRFPGTNWKKDKS